MRRTSVEAYHKIEAEGLLSRLRFECYDLLYHHGPLTAGELMDKARALYPNWSDRHVWSLEKRLSELKDSRVAYEVGRRPCRISGRLCIEWDVTDGLPVEAEKLSPTRNTVRMLLEKVGALENQIAELRRLVEPKPGQQGYFFK